MSLLRTAIGVAVAAVLASGCAVGAVHTAKDETIFLDGDSLHNPVGATTGSGSGSVSGGTVSSSPRSTVKSDDKKEPRGNTPPGVDREGAAPAAGAIVDPAGAATKSKP